MGDYAECHKSHPHIRGKTDGCQEFMKDRVDPMECKVCGCHRNFHRRVKPPVKYKTEVVYTKCHRIHDFKFPNSVDGCQEFIPVGKVGGVALVCATCGCNKGFHRNEIVHFRALERPKEDEFCLELAKNNTYDDVVERVAQRLGLDDPSKILPTPHNCYSQQPKPSPIKYRSVDRLADMLVHDNQLDIPLPELQCLKTLKVAFHHATKDEAVNLNIRLPKQSTVGDMLNEIKTKVELSHPNAELRLLEIFYHKIYKIFPVHEKIENINDRYWTLRAEEIPEEEKNLGPNDRLLHVYYFTKETAQNQVQIQNFGDPFLLVIHEGETLADVKVRIQKKLRVPDEEFSKWKLAFLSLGRPEYLEDSDVVSSRFQRRDVYGAWEQYLGLEHSDTTPKRAYAANRMVAEPPQI